MDYKDEYDHSLNILNEAENSNSSSGTDINSSNPNENEKYNRIEMKRFSRKPSLRGFVSSLTAGVVGSVLTLTILPHTDYVKYLNTGKEAPGTEQVSTVSSPLKTVASKSSASNATGSIADTVEKVSKAIVGIVNYQQQNNNFFSNRGGFDSFGSSDNFDGSGSGSQNVQKGSGSGVIFQKNAESAFIVTNNHVVEGASKLEISLYNAQKTTASVVGTDALTDLAVLKIDAKYVTDSVEFGDSSSLRPGDQVYAIGNPLGLDLSRTVTQGIVSAINRSITVTTSAGNWETNVIQTDAAINPGNSGGALINSLGQVIGINSLKISESGVEGLGFAIPSNDLIPIVNQLIKNGKIERPYLGIGLADLSEVPQMYWQDLSEKVKKGVMVTSIDSQSAAAKSGFKPQDVIVAMNGNEITSSSDLRKYLYTKVNIGDEVKFEVYRDKKMINISVKITGKRTN